MCIKGESSLYICVRRVRDVLDAYLGGFVSRGGQPNSCFHSLVDGL